MKLLVINVKQLHNEHFRFAKDVEKALSEVCLIEIVESTLIICLLEYYCLTVKGCRLGDN